MKEATPAESPTEETLPNGTVYFSNDPYSQNASYFQEFSAFQKQTFSTYFPYSFQHPHLHNEHVTQEQIFQQVFQGPVCVE